MRLLVNVYLLPIAFVVSAYLLISGGYQLEETRYFSQYGVYLVWLGYLFALAALVLALYRGWRVVRAFFGKGEICYQCGGPVSHKSGRYGPYFKCWVCGANRAERF